MQCSCRYLRALLQSEKEGFILMAYDFKNIKVLVVESSPYVLALLQDMLTIFTIPRKNISTASTNEEGFQKFCAENHDLVIVDWIEDPASGIQLTGSSIQSTMT